MAIRVVLAHGIISGRLKLSSLTPFVAIRRSRIPMSLAAEVEEHACEKQIFNERFSAGGF